MSNTTPIVFDPLASTDLNWPAEMVVAIAQGLEDADDIASRFGLDGPRWDRMKQSLAFTRAVAAKRSELAADGWVTIAKARLGTEMMVDELIKLGANSDTPTSQKLAIAEYLTKVAGQFPQPKTGGDKGSGPSFTINIDLSGRGESPKQITIEAPSE